MKLFICSGKRAGKDHAALFLKSDMGLKFQSSSYFAAEEFIFDALKDKYGYSSIDDCFSDRHNHRSEWYDLIRGYNSEDPTKLSTQIFKTNDCYVGIRDRNELAAAKIKWPDCLVLWIDAEGRVESEDERSCTITKDQADIIIENKKSIEDFEEKLVKFSNLIRSYHGGC